MSFLLHQPAVIRLLPGVKIRFLSCFARKLAKKYLGLYPLRVKVNGYQFYNMYKELGYFRKKKILKRANFLELTPVRKYEYETNEKGNAVILIPRFTDFLGKRLLQGRLKHPYIKLELDEAGSTTWLLADGKNSVKDICQLAEAKLGEKIHPSADRVTTFFSQLYMRKLITFNEILK